MAEKFVLQKLILSTDLSNDEASGMYYRSDLRLSSRRDEPGVYVLQPGYYDFFTYFNTLSLGKWRTYTNAKNYQLNLDICGDFQLDVFGHSIDSLENFHKEWIGNYYFGRSQEEIRSGAPAAQTPQRVVIDIPETCTSQVVGFQLTVYGTTRIYGGCYTAEAEKADVHDPRIVLATTTFKRESYVRNNVRLITDSVFSDADLAPHFVWKIIDNGSTLDPTEFKSEYIEVIPNRNVGGSGGFCRGMLEALKQKPKPTHVLLMDDDVSFMPDSFRRVCMLLTLMKPEYKDYFISGAMLEIRQRNIQHEDVGMFRLTGEHGPTKPRYDLNLWDSVIRNEAPLKEDGHQYSGWWYCCIPTTVAREDNLPMPFFIRGDDVEYSIRNHARFITMNGICIWHEGFGTKFSGSMELYQVHRNDLILQTTNEHIGDVNVIDRIKGLYYEAMYRFDYKACNLLLDAVEDFLKGPDFIRTLNGEQCMKDKRALDNQLQPMTAEVKKLVTDFLKTEKARIEASNRTEEVLSDKDVLARSEGLDRAHALLFGVFANGQRRIPEAMAGKKTAFISYGWGFSPRRLYGADKVYAVDLNNSGYVLYTRDRAKYKEVNARFHQLMARYEAEYDSVAKEYQKAEKNFQSKGFWMEYLK